MPKIRASASCIRGTNGIGMQHAGSSKQHAVASGSKAQGETQGVDSHAACRARRRWQHGVATVVVKRFASSSSLRPVPVVLSGGLLRKAALGGIPLGLRLGSCFADIAPCDPHSLPILYWLTGRGMWQLCTGLAAARVVCCRGGVGLCDESGGRCRE